MARLIGTLNEGSLLRRTMLHVGTFVLGSLTFIALMSVLLVTIAKTLLPPHTPEGVAADTADEAESADGSGTNKAASSKTTRSKRPRPAAPTERDSAPTAD
jgi:hypothetical protein